MHHLIHSEYLVRRTRVSLMHPHFLKSRAGILSECIRRASFRFLQRYRPRGLLIYLYHVLFEFSKLFIDNWAHISIESTSMVLFKVIIIVGFFSTSFMRLTVRMILYRCGIVVKIELSIRQTL